VRLRVATDGTILSEGSIKEEKGSEKYETKVAPQPVDKKSDEKKPSFPKGSEKAVEAIKSEFPEAEVMSVRPLIAADDSAPWSGDVESYFVKFRLSGAHLELETTPDGVIIELTLSMEPKDLPKEVLKAIAEEAGEGKIQKAWKQETRARRKYVALKEPRVRFDVTLESEEKKKTAELQLDAKGHRPHNPFKEID
jgi:hypothetical protein